MMCKLMSTWCRHHVLTIWWHEKLKMSWQWRDFRCWHQSENFSFNGDAHLDYTQYSLEPIFNVAWCPNFNSVSNLTHQFLIPILFLTFIPTLSTLQTWMADCITWQYNSHQQKFNPEKKVTESAHPARFSPDDKFSSQRVAMKKRFGVYLPDLPPTKEL